MQTPIQKLEQAKKMLDSGLIDQVDFDLIKKQCLMEMGMATPSESPVDEISVPRVLEESLWGFWWGVDWTFLRYLLWCCSNRRVAQSMYTPKF